MPFTLGEHEIETADFRHRRHRHHHCRRMRPARKERRGRVRESLSLAFVRFRDYRASRTTWHL